jgi:hypothetical protein
MAGRSNPKGFLMMVAIVLAAAAIMAVIAPHLPRTPAPADGGATVNAAR